LAAIQNIENLGDFVEGKFRPKAGEGTAVTVNQFVISPSFTGLLESKT